MVHMRNAIIKYLCSLVIMNILVSAYAVCQGDISSKLLKIDPTISIQKLVAANHFSEELIIMIDQPLDHNDPSKGSFKQRIFFAHYDVNAPMLLVTEGYAAYPQYYELCDLLISNQLIVENRFFGESKPENYDFTFLTNDQIAADYHRIRKLFGKIYKKEWICTGISKGGTNSLIYKSKYPKDVDVVLTYVAPLANATEDKRCESYIKALGEESCGKEIRSFQLAALKEKEKLIKKLESYAIENSYAYSTIDIPKAVEYCILEFPFLFWQDGHQCNRIPNNADNVNNIFDFLDEIVGFDYYADETIEYFRPSFYQFMIENGYYGFDTIGIGHHIEYVSDLSHKAFGPLDLNPLFNADYLKYVRVFLYHYGEKIIYIHGKLDPWSACKLIPPKERDALLVIQEDGDHSTRISTLENAQKKLVYSYLERWLNRKIDDPLIN